MLKRVLWPIAMSALAITLSGCSSSESTKYDVKETVIKPCIVPNDLPNNALGQLGIQTIHISNTYRIIVPVDPVFDIRSSEIKESAYPGLSLLAKQINRHMPTCVNVKGYTDSLGSYPEDQWLSEKQARSLSTYLWTQGVPHECLNPVGIGKDERYTVASNRSVEGAVANRRIELTFRSNK